MVKQHFFKPLLPGFHTHLTIPTAFFLKYKTEHKMAELRSDASKIIWKVKIDGQRLTDGWKEFALSHDLRIGDIVVFRQERDMTFHATILGPSGCEIQYDSCLDYQNNLGKKNPGREAESSSSLDPSCFVANVTPSSLRYDLMHLPRLFVKANGIITGSGKIVLMNEKGRSWTCTLKQQPTCSRSVYLRRGWTRFCGANGLKAGDIITFKLIKGRGSLVLRLLPKDLEEEEEEEGKDVSLSTEPESHEGNIGKIQRKNKTKKHPGIETKSSSQDPSCLVVNIRASTLRYDTLYLPKNFVRENGIDPRCGEMILMDRNGRSWSLVMKQKQSCGIIYIKKGWRSFCHVNALRAGTIITFKLVQKGGVLVLHLTPKEEEEEGLEANEVESLSTDEESDEEISHGEKISQECSGRKEKKGRSRWRPSSSPSLNRFVTLTFKPYTMKSCVLRLPAPFTRINGINIGTKMTLLDKHGFRWSTNLRLDAQKRFRMAGGGWRGFLQANSVKMNESFKLELIWEEDTSCVLKFCSKVKI